MKNSAFKLYGVLIFLIPVSLLAQTPTQKTTTPQTKTQPAVKLTNAADSSQYILGAYLGQYLVTNGLSITKADLFIKGMNDVVTGKPLMVPADSIPKRMNEFLTQSNIERSRFLEKQLFDAVKGQPGVGTLPSGVCYVIVKAGTGPRPQVADSITAHVKGYLPDGRLFEDTYPKNTPLKSTPANLIPGLKETLQIMPEGSLWRIYIPSSLGYAEKGIQGIIPPYSAVVFDVELIKVGTTKK
ncbi:MAG: FKBP-type peptidyl-prolyl cis-trans isomerase [Bacteroidales bacterium]|jgi:FKBP-type peptidyl-prolyl cis-trans isomerase